MQIYHNARMRTVSPQFCSRPTFNQMVQLLRGLRISWGFPQWMTKVARFFVALCVTVNSSPLREGPAKKAINRRSATGTCLIDIVTITSTQHFTPPSSYHGSWEM